jgi:hypothetical protein
MSIIQMIAIVTFKEIHIVNIVSILFSIISVASKCVVISYSPHRPTFVFNFFCFFGDIFKFFCKFFFIFILPILYFLEGGAQLAKLYMIKNLNI